MKNTIVKILVGILALLGVGGTYLGAQTYTVTKLNGRINVGTQGAFQTIKEATDWVNANATKGYEIIVDSGNHLITDTITVSSSYPTVIRGLNIDTTVLQAGTGLTGKPMIQCNTDCYVNRLSATGATLANYGTVAGENFVTLNQKISLSSEITDFTATNFYSVIADYASADLFVFNSVMENSKNGVEINHVDGGVSFADIEINTFENCSTSINLYKATTAGFAIMSNVFEIPTGSIGINYQPTTFTFSGLTNIIGNTFSSTGTSTQGFDFTREDGRDADVEIISNINLEDKIPHFQLSTSDNTTSTVVTTAGTYYKPEWTNDFNYGVKSWQVGNKATYLSSHRKDAIFNISGNVSVDKLNRNVIIKLRFNGITLTSQQMTVRTITADQPYPFSFDVYVEGIKKNDYVEVVLTSSSDGDVVTVRDLTLTGEAR